MGQQYTSHPGFFVEVVADYDTLSSRAAQRLVQLLEAKPDLLLCASAGETPSGTYRLVAQHFKENSARFKSLRVLKVDEWSGLSMDDPGACETQLKTQLLKPLQVPEERYFGFQSDTAEPAAECRRLAEWLDRCGPIDLCILGLGANGHIAMNEPGHVLQPFAHVAPLSESSLRHPMLAKSAKRPRYGLTLGIAEILASRQILLLVSGEKKREAMRRLLRPEITTDFPASLLWTHGNCTVLSDKQATG